MNFITKLSCSVAIVFGLSSLGVHAQQKHGDHTMKHTGEMKHAGEMKHDGAMKHHGSADEVNLPTQQGQSGFAAIAEIVEILNQDAATDWSVINLPALREHLVDMNELTLQSEVKAEYEANEARFFVTGEGRTLKAIQNMVPAHAKELTKIDDWSVKGTLLENGAILHISADTPEVMMKIKGLGFYGLMATGAHHQEHHLAIAKGDMHAHH